MEYEVQEKQYTLGEFYNLYEDKLPTIVMVTQGFCGDILAETFDYGQVIRIHSVCRQQRVIAVRLNDHKTEECTYSFPVDYPIEFCLDPGLYQSKSLKLTEILEKRSLPVDVQFARRQFIKIGDDTSSTSHFSNFRLTNIFDEIYLLANFVFDGEFDPPIIQIPLYLSAIRLSEVTGLKDKGNSEWKAFKRKLDEKASQLNFYYVCGNPEIARYKPDSISRLVSTNVEADVPIYENFQPQTYTNIGELMEKNRSSQSGNASGDDDDPYEPVVTGPLATTKDKAIRNTSYSHKAEQKKHQRQSHLSVANLVGELTDMFNKGLVQLKKAGSSANPPKIRLKKKLNIVASKLHLAREKPEEEVTSEKVAEFNPPIRRPSECSMSELNTGRTISTPLRDLYENIKIVRVEVPPLSCHTASHPQRLSVSLDEEHTDMNRQSQIQPSNHQQSEDRKDNGTMNVKRLKVGELGRWMSDKLRLGKHVARFAEELVDGAMLFDLNENLLIEEFGFSPIEAKRLMKFAKEGHVPQ